MWSPPTPAAAASACDASANTSGVNHSRICPFAARRSEVWIAFGISRARLRRCARLPAALISVAIRITSSINAASAASRISSARGICPRTGSRHRPIRRAVYIRATSVNPASRN